MLMNLRGKRWRWRSCFTDYLEKDLRKLFLLCSFVVGIKRYLTHLIHVANFANASLNVFITTFSVPKTASLFSFSCTVFPVCSDWTAHTCLSRRHLPRLWSTLLDVIFLLAVFLPQSQAWIMQICDTVMKWCQEVTELKAGLLTGGFGHFRSSSLCGTEELPLGFLTFKTFCMHKNLYKTLKERERQKSAIGLL